MGRAIISSSMCVGAQHVRDAMLVILSVASIFGSCISLLALRRQL